MLNNFLRQNICCLVLIKLPFLDKLYLGFHSVLFTDSCYARALLQGENSKYKICKKSKAICS